MATPASSFRNPVLWLLFLLYILVAGYTMLHHEPWLDELHSWNIAKGSTSYSNLIWNRRFEGHPPLWHTVLWLISRCTHQLIYVQLVQLLIAAAVVFLVLFYAPLPLSIRALIPFGYYFLFEYAILSRNYGLGILLALAICIILHRSFRYRLVLYYGLLFLLSNTHLVTLVLAASLHLYFLLLRLEQGDNRRYIALHFLAGALVLFPALYFIAPPSNGENNTAFWIRTWKKDQLALALQAPLRAFVPMPAWWEYHFWNKPFLFEWQARFRFLRFITPVASMGCTVLACYLLKKNRKSLLFFLCNVLLTLAVGIIFPLSTQRYVGFIFIGFILALWLFGLQASPDKRRSRIIVVLLGIQLIAGAFITVKDIRLPFANAYQVNALIGEVPPGRKVVTDYWALNTLSAYTNRPFYCLDLQQERSFILWTSDMTMIRANPNRYYNGVRYLFRQEGLHEVYMISSGPLDRIGRADTQLLQAYKVTLVDKKDDAIEPGSNIYLYHIEER